MNTAIGYCELCGTVHLPSTAGCPPKPTYPMPINVRRESAMPFKCPVCNGQGTVWTPPNVPGDQPTYTSDRIETHQCRPCSGTGIVWGPPA